MDKCCIVREMDIWQAIENDRTVLAPDGTECRVVKFKNGRAKIRHYTDDGRVFEAWVEIGSLRTKE